MQYSDIQKIIVKYQNLQGFPKEFLPLIEDLQNIMEHAEQLFGKRDSTINFDLVFEDRLFTDFCKSPFEISLGKIDGLVLPHNGYSEVKRRMAQELTQILTWPIKVGDCQFQLRNIDKGISTHFALENVPGRGSFQNGYGRANQLFNKFLKYANTIDPIRKLREKEGIAIAEISNDNLKETFSKVPESIVSDLTEVWIHDAGYFPRYDEWIVL